MRNGRRKEELSQWYFKITDYAERLLDNLDKLPGWPNKVKLMQKNWIGKSMGAEVTFEIEGFDKGMDIFTTRPDTLYGVTYMVMAPEHPYLKELVAGSEYEEPVAAYVDKVQHMSDIEDLDGKRKDRSVHRKICHKSFERQESTYIHFGLRSDGLRYRCDNGCACS